MAYKMKGFSGFKNSPAKHIKHGGGDHNRMNHWDPETESYSKEGHSERKQEEPVKAVEEKKEEKKPEETKYDDQGVKIASDDIKTKVALAEISKMKKAPTKKVKDFVKAGVDTVRDVVAEKGLKKSPKIAGKGAKKWLGRALGRVSGPVSVMSLTHKLAQRKESAPTIYKDRKTGYMDAGKKKLT